MLLLLLVSVFVLVLVLLLLLPVVGVFGIAIAEWIIFYCVGWHGSSRYLDIFFSSLNLPSPLHCRYLMILWHTLLALPLAVLFSQWDWSMLDMARQWLGCVLLALSAAQLGTVSAQVVERSARHGLVVAVRRALRSVDGDYDNQVGVLV